MQRNHMNSQPTHFLSRTQPLNHKSQTFVHIHRYGHFHACADTETRHRHYTGSPVLNFGVQRVHALSRSSQPLLAGATLPRVPSPSTLTPSPGYLAVQANRNKVCAVRTVRGRKNGSRCLQAS